MKWCIIKGMTKTACSIDSKGVFMKGQISIFDITTEPATEAGSNTETQMTREKCPYKIPTLNEIMKLFDGAIYRVDRHKLLSDLFEVGAIVISNQVDFNHAKEREERYKQIMESYNPEERELLVKLWCNVYSLLSSMTYADGEFNDWLGILYMQSNTNNKEAGQFFTPYCISKACAKITVEKEKVDQHKKDGEIFSICEPACGSGGMILAVLDTLYNDYNYNYTENVFVEASDIDVRCVHMCYLQLSLAGVPAIVKQQDALSRKLYNVWYTPAYCFQYLRFRKFEKCAII